MRYIKVNFLQFLYLKSEILSVDSIQVVFCLYNIVLIFLFIRRKQNNYQGSNTGTVNNIPAKAKQNTRQAQSKQYNSVRACFNNGKVSRFFQDFSKQLYLNNEKAISISMSARLCGKMSQRTASDCKASSKRKCSYCMSHEWPNVLHNYIMCQLTQVINKII